MPTSTPRIHAPSAVRVLALFVAMVALWVSFATVRSMLSVGAWGWLLFATGLIAAPAIAILRREVRPPPHCVYARWREVGAGAELFIAGLGALFLWMSLGAGLMAFEVGHGAGRGGEAGCLGMFYFAGLALVLIRPVTVLDLEKRTARYHLFGAGVPLASALPMGELRLQADAYMRTNTGVRLGTMIRGYVGGKSFELEFIPGGTPHPETINARLAHWAHALGVNGT